MNTDLHLVHRLGPITQSTAPTIDIMSGDGKNLDGHVVISKKGVSDFRVDFTGRRESPANAWSLNLNPDQTDHLTHPQETALINIIRTHLRENSEAQRDAA